MKITIRKCVDGKIWDELVEKSVKSTTFHRWDWLKIVEKHSGTKLNPLIASMGSNDVGIIPVFTKKTKGMKLAFSPPPKCALTYLGPLSIQYDKVLKYQTMEKTMHSYMDAFIKYIKTEYKPNYTRLNLSPGYNDVRPLTWNNYDTSPEYTYISDISGGEDAIFSNYQKQLRTDLKKTIKEGVTVKEGGKQELNKIHDELISRFTEQGLQTNITKEYLNDLYKKFHNKEMNIFYASYQGEQVGGFICITHPDRASYWAGGGKTTIKGIYPNDLLQYETMKWAHEKGYKKYEIVDAGDKRLRHFKSKFNPQLKNWFQTEKYSPKTIKHIEPTIRKILKVVGGKGLS